MFSKQGIICMSAEMVDRMDIHGMDKRPKNLTLGNYIEREGTGQRTVTKGKTEVITGHCFQLYYQIHFATFIHSIPQLDYIFHNGENKFLPINTICINALRFECIVLC